MPRDRCAKTRQTLKVLRSSRKRIDKRGQMADGDKMGEVRRAQEVAKRMLDYCIAHPGTKGKIVSCVAGYKTEALESLVPAGTVHERDKCRFVFANGSVIDYAPIQYTVKAASPDTEAWPDAPTKAPVHEGEVQEQGGCETEP